MGANRELKKATEAYWGGKISQEELLTEAKRLRLEHWNIQKKAGVDVIPSNDFALYDQVLTHIQDFGVSSPLFQHIYRMLTMNLAGRSREIYQEQPRSYRYILRHGPWSPEG
jgi:hypothetical protein